MSLIDFLLSIVAPHDCLGCGQEGNLLCLSCLNSLPPAPACSSRFITLGAVSAVTNYSGAAKALVWQLKSAGAQAASEIMAKRMRALLEQNSGLTIVPVPTATSRVRQRGYDQAKLLAKALARQTGLPYLDCLTRIGQTHQVGASRPQRLHQLSDAFRVRKPAKVQGARLLLVDDVSTTGATLEMAAMALKKAGAGQVEAIVFAQA